MTIDLLSADAILSPMDTTTHESKCFTCGTTVERYDAYCAKCIEAQRREQGDEREAFDAFHAFADAVARRPR